MKPEGKRPKPLTNLATRIFPFGRARFGAGSIPAACSSLYISISTSHRRDNSRDHTTHIQQDRQSVYRCGDTMTVTKRRVKAEPSGAEGTGELNLNKGVRRVTNT